jgi:hypothetical protein
MHKYRNFQATHADNSHYDRNVSVRLPTGKVVRSLFTVQSIFLWSAHIDFEYIPTDCKGTRL